MKLLPLITEDHKHEYGCVLLHFDYPEFSKIQDIINPNDLYEDPDDDSYGLETELHVTLLYGLHDRVSDEDVKSVLKGIIFDTCKLINPSIFENDEYDVLKFDVAYATRGGSFLSKANRELKKFPHTSEFPDYHPHATIAYLKPDKGKKYAEILKKKIDDVIVTPKYATYSKINGTKTKISIKLR